MTDNVLGPGVQILRRPSAWPDSTQNIELSPGARWVVLRKAPVSFLLLQLSDGRETRLYVGQPMPLDPKTRHRVVCAGSLQDAVDEPANTTLAYVDREIELHCSDERPFPGGAVHFFARWFCEANSTPTYRGGCAGARHVAARYSKDNGQATHQLETFMAPNVSTWQTRDRLPTETGSTLAAGSAGGDTVQWGMGPTPYTTGVTSYGYGTVAEVFGANLNVRNYTGGTYADIEVIMSMEIR